MDWIVKHNFLHKIHSQMQPKEKERSHVGYWKMNDLYDLREKRAALRIFGQCVARIDRNDEFQLAKFAIEAIDRFDGILGKHINNAFEWSPRRIIEKFNEELDNAYAADINKFSKGEWTYVPWAKTLWWDASPYKYIHSLHMSKETPGNITFAENAAKRKLGRYTSMKPGRYLARFFPELPESEVKLWAEKCAALSTPLKLHFVESNDPDGWVRVYRDGPDSCMQGEDCVKVYAHDKSVLRLAYTTRGEEIVGRCIVREDTKEYVRVYPNNNSTEDMRIQTATRELIEQAGYTHGNLYGVTVKAIPASKYSETYVMPYIDYGTADYPCVELTSNGEYFMLGTTGVSATETGGTITLQEMSECEDCNERVPDDDITYVDHEERHVCDDCLDHNYVNAYGRRNFMVLAHEDNVIINQSDGEYYIEEYANHHDVYQCEYSGSWYSADDLVSTSFGMVHVNHAAELDEEDGDGNNYALTRDTVETHDGRTIHESDAMEVNGKTYHRNDDIDETDNEGEE